MKNRIPASRNSHLGVRELCDLMNVSEKTVYHWIKDEELPAVKVNEQYRFNRTELLEWAIARRIDVSSGLFDGHGGGSVPLPGLADALKAGGVNYGVDAADKRAALKSAISLMPLPENADRGFLLDVFLARESLGSTGIGDGIAIPHVRNPVVMRIQGPMVTLCFLKNGIEFGSIDGKPVHTIFTMMSPSVTAHLNILSKLTFALRNKVFADAIARRAAQDEIYRGAQEADKTMKSRAAHTEGAGGM